MNRRVRFFGALLLAILLLMTACERGQEESSAPETTEATIGETVAATEPEKTMTQEERNQLYRRVDYAVVDRQFIQGDIGKGTRYLMQIRTMQKNCLFPAKERSYGGLFLLLTITQIISPLQSVM